MPGKDTRVVDMQFQNKNFEKNIATSQKSLSRFKKELNFDETSKGLEKFGKNMDSLKFDKFFDNIQRLTDKFTGIGDIGEFMISKVRHSLEEAANSAIRFAKSLTFDQIDVGKQKFEDLNKSIQTIKAATGKTEEEVSDVLARLNEYTDMTSYNFSDMAANIGKFTSVGIPLEQAEKQMEGIANWAARSGAGIQEASRAMYNLSQAMGVGSLKLMDWKSIENAGMATKEFKEQLIEAGLAAGTLVAETKKDANGVEQTVYKTSKNLGKQIEVNFQNMSQTLSKGWANTTVIGNTLLGYYYEDLEFKNAEGLKKLTEDQEKMFDEMFKQYGVIDDKRWKKLSDEGLGSNDLKQSLLDTAEAMGTLTSEVNSDGQKIYTTTDKTGKKIQFTLDTFEKGLAGGWLNRNIAKTVYSFDNLAKGSYEAAMKCLSFTDVLNAWKDMISTGWMASLQHIFGGLSDSIEVFTAMCNKAGEILGSVFGVNGAINKILGIWDNKENRDTLWGMIIGEYDDGEKKLYEGAYGLFDVIKDVGGIISGAFWDIMKDFASDVYGEDKLAEWETDTELRYAFLADKLQTFVEKIRYAIFQVKEFFQEIPEGASKSRWETIKDIVGAVFRVVSLAAQTISGIFTFFGKIKKQLEPSIIAITDLISSIAGGVTGAEKDLRKSKGIQRFFSNFADALVPVTNFINKVVIGLTKLIKGFVKWGVEGGHFIKIWETIKSVFKGVINVFDKLSKPILKFFKDIGPAIGDFFTKGLNKDTIKQFGKALGKAFGELFNNFASYIPGLWTKIKGFFATIFNGVKNILNSQESGVLGTIIGFISRIFSGVFKFLKNLGGRISDDNSVFSIIMRVLGTGIEFVGDLFVKIIGSLNGISLYDVVMIILGGTVILSAFSLIKSALGIIKGIKNIIFGFGDILEAIAYRIKGSDGSEKFLRIAKGIAIIGLAIVILGQMPWYEALQGVAVVGAIAGIVILITKVMGKMLEKIKFTSIIKMSIAIISLSAGILIFSAGVYVLVRALKPLANINWDGLAKMATGLAGILTLFSLFAFISKMAKVNFSAMAGFGILGIGIGIMVNSLKPLTELNWAKMAKMAAGLGVILLMFAGFSHIMGSIKDKGIGQTAFLAIGIAILVEALIPLADMNWDKMAHMGVGLLAILILLAGFSHIAGSLKGKSMKSTITLALGIVILMEAIKPLANYNWERLGKMGSGLTVLLLMLGLFTRLSGSLKKKSMKSTITLALGIVILMESLKPLANYSWESLGKMFASLTVILFELIEFSKNMESIKGKGIGAAILLAASIYIFMESLKPLGNYNWEDLGKMFAGLSIMLFDLVEFSKHLESIKGKGIGNAILLAAGIYVIIEAIKPLASMDWEGLGKMGAGLSGILTILVIASKKIEQINFKVSGGIIVFSAAIYAMLYVLKPLANYEWEELAKLGVGLLAVILMLGIAAKSIKDIDWKNALGSFAMMLGMAVMISVFGKTLDKVKDIETTKLLGFAASVVILSIAIRIVLSSINKLEAQTKGIEIGSKLAMIVAALVTVGWLMFELALLVPKINDADISKLVAFVISVDILMPSLLIAAAAINKVDNARTGADVGKKLGLFAMAFISVGALLAELALFIPRINSSDIVKIVGFVVSVDILMPSLLIAASAINKIKDLRTGADVGRKFALVIAALISVGVLLAELALFIPRINNSDVLKVIGFSVAVDAIMPSLIIAASAINKIQAPRTGKEVVSKFSLMLTSIIAVAVLMGELAYLIPLINKLDTSSWANASKLIVFAAGVEAIIPALITTAIAINKIKVPTKTKSGGKKGKGNVQKPSFGATFETMLLFAEAVAAMAIIMAEIAYLIPLINNIDASSWGNGSKLIVFAGAVEAIMPALITVAIAISKIKLPTLKGSGGSSKKSSLFHRGKVSIGERTKTKNAEETLPGLKDVSGLMAIIGAAALIFGLVTLELAALIPMINKIDASSVGNISKILVFAGAVEAIMPALITVANAISKIKVPSISFGGSEVAAASYVDKKSTIGQYNEKKGKNVKNLKFKELYGFFAVLGIAVATFSWLLFEIASLIPMINKIDSSSFASISKILVFASAVEAIMPALIIVAKAINMIEIPTITNKQGKNEKTEAIKFKDITGYLGIIGIAVIAMGTIMAELAWIANYINLVDESSIYKLLGFALAVDIIMPALIIVAKAISAIEIPTLTNGTGKNKKTETIKFKELTGYFGIIGIAVIAMGAIMAELAALIPLIDQINGWQGMAKLVVFAITIELIMPALMTVADAIGKIEIPKNGKKVLKAKELTGYYGILAIAIGALALIISEMASRIYLINQIDGWQGLAKLVVFALAINLVMPALLTVADAIAKIDIPKNGKKVLSAKDLTGYYGILGIAIGAMALIISEMASRIYLINEIDGWQGLAKIVVFAIAIDIVMPALMTVADAIGKIQIPTNGKKVLQAKDLSGYFAILGIAIATMAMVIGELALLIPAINGIDGWQGIAKLVVFAITIELIMPALMTVADAIGKIQIPTNNKKVLKFKDLTGYFAILGIAIATMALIIGELALLIPSINGIDGWEGIAKLVTFAIVIELVMPALLTVADAINKIELPKNGKNILKPKDMASRFILIGMAVGTLALVMGEIALLIPAINGIDGFSGIAKLITFAITVNIVMAALLTVVDAIEKIEVPTNSKKVLSPSEMKSKFILIGMAIGTIALIMGELALLIPSINNIDGIGGIAKLLVFSITVNVIMAAILTVVDAINKIKTPTSKDALTKKIKLIGIAIGAVALLMAELALFIYRINDANVGKMIVFALSIEALMPALMIAVEAINKIKTPTSKDALEKKLWIFGAAFVAVAAVMGELALLVNQINESQIFKLIGFAISVYLVMPSLAKVVSIINDIDVPEDSTELKMKLGILAGALVTLAAIIAELSAFTSTINTGDFTKLLGFAAIVYLIMPSLEKVVGMIDDIEAPDEGKELGFKLAIMAGALIAVAAIIAELAAFTSQINASNFESMLGFAVAIYLILPSLGKVIEAIGEIEAPEEGKEVGFKLAIMAGALIAVAALIAELALFTNQINNADILKIMGFAIAVDLVIPALIMAIYGINKIEAPESWGDVGKKVLMMIAAVVAVGALMAVLALVIDKAQGIDPIGMIAFSASVLVLGLAVAMMVSVIGSIKQSAMNNLGKRLALLIVATVAIGALMFLLSEMIDKLKDIDPKAMLAFSASIILLVVALAGVAAVVAMLGKIDLAVITKGSAGLVVVATALGAAIDVIASFAKSAIDKMTTALIDLGTALKWFDEDVSLIDSERVRQGMSLLKDLCDVAIYVVQKGDLSKQLDNYSTAMARLGAGIWLFNDNAGSTASINRAKTAISDIVEMSNKLSSLTTIGNVSNTIANIAGAIKIYIETLNGQKIEDAPDSSKIRDVFVALNDAIPDDTLVAGASEFADATKSADLNSYAIGLANISTALSSFATATKDMDFKDVDTAIAKLQAIGDLGPVISEGITAKIDIGDFLNFEASVVREKESLTQFAEDIKLLASALRSFGTEMSSLTQDEWDKVDDGILALDKFSRIQNNLPMVGGFLDAIVGTQDLTTFGKKLPSVGKGLKGFCTEMAGAEALDNGEAETASKVLMELAKASKEIPRNGGLFSVFSSTDVGKFGDQLGPLGAGVRAFADSVNGIPGLDDQQLATATDILIGICEAASKIPSNEGLITLFKNTNYEEFGKESMGYLAEGVSEFATKVKGIPGLSTGELKTASDILVSICTAASKIPANSGLITLFQGINYSTFSEDMGHMGAGLVSFAENVAGLMRQSHKIKGDELTDDELSVIDSVTRLTESFATLVDTLSKLTGISKELTSKSSQIRNQMYTIGNDLGQSMIYFLEGLFTENETSREDRKAKLEKVVADYETYMPVVKEFVDLMGQLSIIAKTDASTTEGMLTGLTAGLQSFLTFDADIPWTSKHTDLLNQIISVCDSLAGMSSYLQYTVEQSEAGSGFTGITKWFTDLATAYGQFDGAVIDLANIGHEKWSGEYLDVVNQIKEVSDILGTMSNYVLLYEPGDLITWFTDIVKAYAKFSEDMNALLMDPNDPYTWTDGMIAAFTRIQQLVEIVKTLDEIEPPSITPILDIDDFDQQLSKWGKKPLPNVGFGVNSSITFKLDTEQFDALASKDYSVKLALLTSEVTSLKETVSNVNTKLNSVRLIMDPNAMIRAIGPGINLYLGRGSFEATRGISSP